MIGATPNGCSTPVGAWTGVWVMEPDSRTRWRCRRGMLENDWLLGHFLAQGYAQLDQEGRDAFERLLDYPDNVLLDVVMGRQTTVDDGIARLVPAIRAAAQAAAPT